MLDWMMQLPEEIELELWQDIESTEGERSVKYVTSVERLTIACVLPHIDQNLPAGDETSCPSLRSTEPVRKFTLNIQ